MKVDTAVTQLPNNNRESFKEYCVWLIDTVSPELRKQSFEWDCVHTVMFLSTTLFLILSPHLHVTNFHVLTQTGFSIFMTFLWRSGFSVYFAKKPAQYSL